MIRRSVIAPAAVPLAAWSDLQALPALRAKRARLHDLLIHGCQRSARAAARREDLACITHDILTREARLRALGIDPEGVAFPAPRPFSETEH